MVFEKSDLTIRYHATKLTTGRGSDWKNILGHADPLEQFFFTIGIKISNDKNSPKIGKSYQKVS